MAWFVVLPWLLVQPASAASPPAGVLHLVVDGEQAEGSLALDVRTLDAALNLDVNGDGSIAWLEIEPRRDELQRYLENRIDVLADGLPVKPAWSGMVFGSQDGRDLIRADLQFQGSDAIRSLTIGCDVGTPSAAGDACRIDIVWPGDRLESATLSGSDLPRNFDAASTGLGTLMRRFIVSGVWHIWIGFDHVLFLLALLIPAVYRPGDRELTPESQFRPVAVRVASIVTAFTLTHSLTLTAAVLGWLSVPGRIVEPTIAASVFVAAAHNLRPGLLRHSSVLMAAGFGLLHGFGFAGVLGEDVPSGAGTVPALVSFNLGVELGQLSIVALFLPISFALRRTRLYRIGVLQLGSIAVASCAVVWFFQRISGS